MSRYLLAIDQGTTSTRAIIFDPQCRLLNQAQQEFQQHFPHNGWVEHDPEEIWGSTLAVIHEVIEKQGIEPDAIAAIGITNQRETTIVWDKATGKPIHNAIVWQDRRTAETCDKLKQAGHEHWVQSKTGLLLDPYFSATKIQWILQNVSGAQERAAKGELAFGTIDSFLLWRLTNGKSHFTDATNASRTLLFNIHQQEWDEELLQLFDIPKAMLPDVLDCSADFGVTDKSILNAEIPITGIAGDQQAALFGQTCFSPGMAKSTYGTGCFLIANTGDNVIESKSRLLATTAYRLNGKVCYGLEGSIFSAGTTIKWLRDNLHFFSNVNETEQLARSVDDNGGVYFVPAFTGLGAPHWDPHARAAILGITRDTGVAHIVRAGLEAVCFQSLELQKC